MKYKIYEWIYDAWFSFWYHLIYRSKTIGNYRKTTNRFTGIHRGAKIHPLARAGVRFSKEQTDFINLLLKDERTLEAQELILEEIGKEMNFDGLAEAFIETARQLENPAIAED